MAFFIVRTLQSPPERVQLKAIATHSRWQNVPRRGSIQNANLRLTDCSHSVRFAGGHIQLMPTTTEHKLIWYELT